MPPAPLACLRAFGSLLLVSLGLSSGEAHAAASLDLTFAAPAACPSAESFERMVARRLESRERAAHIVAAQSFAVEIRATTEGWEGWVRQLSGPAVSHEPRSITTADRDCLPLAEALSLTVALSVTALSEPSGVEQQVVVVSTKPRDLEHPSLWGLGAGVDASGLLSGGGLRGAGLFVERLPRPPSRGIAVGWPDLRLTLSAGRNGRAESVQVQVTFATASLDVCPVSGAVSPSAYFGLCGRAQLGWARGRGVAVDQPLTGGMSFAAAGALARWRLAMGKRWFFEGQLGAIAPVRPLRFVFEMPRAEVASSPSLAWTAGIWIGVTIPGIKSGSVRHL